MLPLATSVRLCLEKTNIERAGGGINGASSIGTSVDDYPSAAGTSMDAGYSCFDIAPCVSIMS